MDKRKPTIAELKKALGLDKYSVIRKPIVIKKDGKHLYKVAGFSYPLKWQTLERLNIPNQKILYEVDHEAWIKEMREARNEQGKAPNNEDDGRD